MHHNETHQKFAKSELMLIVIILVVGFILRIGYLWEIEHSSKLSSLTGDADFHNYWAKALVSGNWDLPESCSDPQIYKNPYLKPPGYPYFLAGLFRLSDNSELFARICQMVLGLISSVIAWLIGRSIFNRSVGLIWAALMSIYWIFIYYEGQFLEPVLQINLTLICIWFLTLWVRKFSKLYLIVASLVFGLAIIVRANCLLVAPVLVFWVLWVSHQALKWRGALISSACAIIGIIIPIIPVTVRNYVVAKDFVLVSANAGINFAIGNCPPSEGYYVGFYLKDKGSFESCYQYPFIVKAMEEVAGRPLKYSEVSQYLFKIAFSYMRAHPIESIKLTLKKAILFWNPKEIEHNSYIQETRNTSIFLRIIPLNFPFVLSLFCMGLGCLVLKVRRFRNNLEQLFPMGKKSWQISVFLLLFIFIYYSSYIPFFFSAMFRVPVIPFLLLFGSYGFYCIVCSLYAKKFLKAAALMICWGALYLIATIDFFPADWAGSHKDAGDMYIIMGHPNNAIDEYKNALKYNPNYAEVYYGMGFVFYQEENYKLAVDSFQKAIDINPDYAIAHDNLGIALLRLENIEEALVHFTKAKQLNADVKSPENFAMRLLPEYAEVYIYVGSLFAQRDKVDEATYYLRKAVELKPDLSKAHYWLALILYQQSYLDEAAIHFMEAVRLQPDNIEAHYKLAEIFTQKGNISQALEHYQEILRIDPSNQEVRKIITKLKIAPMEQKSQPDEISE